MVDLPQQHLGPVARRPHLAFGGILLGLEACFLNRLLEG